jgi:hypothetical protein
LASATNQQRRAFPERSQLAAAAIESLPDCGGGRSTRLWQPDELPRVHTIDLTMNPADFQWQ